MDVIVKSSHRRIALEEERYWLCLRKEPIETTMTERQMREERH